MVLKTFVTLALVTGLAAAKPINTLHSLPAYPVKRQSFDLANQGFSFIDGFNNFNKQEQVIQVQEQNLQIVDNGFQQQVVQQVNEVLIVNQQQDGFNRDLNNLFRKSNFRNQRKEEATVMLVVQQIQVSVADDRGNAFQQDIFAQTALVANRGAPVTSTVMIFESKTLIAQDILGNNRNGIGGFAGAGTGAALLPTKTAGLQLFGSRPTWSVVAEDPAATLGAVWQAELEDLQKVEQDEADNKVNEEAARKEKEAFDQAKAEEEKKAQEQAQQEQKKAEEQAHEELKKAEEQAQQEQKKVEEQAQQEQQQQEQQQNAEQAQEQQKAKVAHPAEANMPSS